MKSRSLSTKPSLMHTFVGTDSSNWLTIVNEDLCIFYVVYLCMSMSKLENSNALTLCLGFTPWATTTVQSTPRYTAPTETRPPGQSSRL